MAYDQNLANRVRKVLCHRSDIDERVMFGGLAFMASGHMCCGLVGDKLMVRVDLKAYNQLLSEPGTEPMDFTGRPMRGFLYVSGAGISTSANLRTWVSRSLEYIESLPPKTKERARAKSSRRPNQALQPTRRTGPTERRRSASRG